MLFTVLKLILVRGVVRSPENIYVGGLCLNSWRLKSVGFCRKAVHLFFHRTGYAIDGVVYYNLSETFWFLGRKPSWSLNLIWLPISIIVVFPKPLEIFRNRYFSEQLSVTSLDSKCDIKMITDHFFLQH